jgi:hypothetical protein
MGTSGSLPPIPSNGNAMGIASLAIGTLSLPVGCFCGLMCFPFGILGLVMGIVGVCLSVIAMRQGSNYGERNVIAILGLLVSGLAVILTLIPLLFVAAAMIAAVLNP